MDLLKSRITQKREEIKYSIQRAEKYISILLKFKEFYKETKWDIEKHHIWNNLTDNKKQSIVDRIGLINEDLIWLSSNAVILQKEVKEISPQLEWYMSNGHGRSLAKLESNIIATFPQYIQSGFPHWVMNIGQEKAILTAIEQNLRTYIQISGEFVQNKTKLKKMIKHNNRHWKIVEFNKTKVMEILFGIGWVASLPLLLNKDLFIYGFIMNIVSGILMLILSFIKLETE